MKDLLTARQAALLLGISRQTLYSYVSRGMLRAYEADASRERRYDADAVKRLALDRRRGRRPKEAAKTALDWGLPVLESAITLIAGGRLWYRGIDAVAFAATAELEDAAALLWSLPRDTAFRPAFRPARKPMSASPFAASDQDLLSRFAIMTKRGTGGEWLAGECGTIIRMLAACVTDQPLSIEPIHQQCARAWELDAAGAALIRKALVLSADHELNASGFTVRCVASTGANLRSVIAAGLAALSGPLHGGMTDRIEEFWEDLDTMASRGGTARHVTVGGMVPGFGHPLYPDGDPRATALLGDLLPRDPAVARFIEAGERLSGKHATLDAALVALRRHLRLPRGAAYKLFALGRSIGWIAHAIEQRRAGQLIRPRASYVGPTPPTDR